MAAALAAAFLILAALSVVILRKVSLMSQSFDSLKSAADAAVAKLASLQTQLDSQSAMIATLQAAQGTSDAALDSVTAELNAALVPAAAPVAAAAPAA